jgi:hypothetical protein
MNKPSIRQLKYARGVMDGDKTKQQVALDAGFSSTTARVPKLIENKRGFKIALAHLAGEGGYTMMKMMYELQSRDLSKMSNKDLTQCFDVMAKNIERLNSILSRI